MGRRSLVTAGVVIALVATACGGDDAAETTTTAAPPSTVATTTSTSSTTTTTLATTTTDDGLVATATTLVVQVDLTALGYFEGAIDGIAGPETQSAIARFQGDAGIEADGVFGPVTDEAMVPQLQALPEYVEQVQEDLTERELYTGPIDGDYGDGTRAAVEKLQAECELEETGELEINTRICLAGL